MISNSYKDSDETWCSADNYLRSLYLISWILAIFVYGDRMRYDCCDTVGSTYVIRSLDKIKIGRSTKLAKRIDGLKGMSPAPIELLAWSNDINLEKLLHHECVQWHSHYEWFELGAWEHIKPFFSNPKKCAACCIYERNMKSIYEERKAARMSCRNSKKKTY